MSDTPDLPRPEFSRPVKLDALGPGDPVAIEADPAERAALAARFDLIGIDRLTARIALRKAADGVIAEGTISAALIQSCVASGVPVPATLDAPVALRLVPPGMLDAAEEEVELESDALDIIEHDGRTIDLGEIAAQTMALALDPYPRAPDAETVLKQAGVVGEDDHATGPFAALKALKKS